MDELVRKHSDDVLKIECHQKQYSGLQVSMYYCYGQSK
jgi:hypothetical protein